jgi:hypothetical protein
MPEEYLAKSIAARFADPKPRRRPTMPGLNIKTRFNHSPHVVILGAGASRACCPSGDRNGRKLPLMADFVESVGLEDIIRASGHQPAGNVETTYSNIPPDTLADALTFHPAIELAASRYAPGTGNRAATAFDGIADNGSGGAAVLGPAADAWRVLQFETMPIDARIDGSPPIQANSGPYRRHPLAIVAEAFSDLRNRGVPLEPGTFLLTGSLTLPTTIRPGQTLIATFADLPPLSLTLT